MSKIEPGKYLGTVEDYGIIKSGQKGTPGLNVKFRLKDSGLNVYWQQWITEGTKERLVETLIETELLRTKNLADLADGRSSGGLCTETEVELVVINEEYTTENGEVKTATKVEFVNPIGGREMKGKLAKAEAVSILGGLNLEAEVLAASTKLGKEVGAKTGQPAADDIPF